MDILRLIRVSHYTKNLLIFAPLFFAGQITDPTRLLDALVAFAAFCFAASAMYIINDWRDIESDRLHPTKKNRPLVTGIVTIRHAMVTAAILGTAALATAFLHSIALLGIVTAYLVFTAAYSISLKKIALIDVMVIAIGFVLRLFAGAIAAGVTLSIWIVIMTFLLALFLALAKRRDDVLLFEQTGQVLRPTVEGYNLRFLDSATAIMASVIIVSYIAYTTSGEIIRRYDAIYLYLTVLFVILGILRYLQITLVMENSGAPVDIVLTDRFLQLVILAWLACFTFAIY